MAGVESGDKVIIHYTGKFEDGTVFDSSLESEPIEFTAGGKDLIPGVSNAVIGMKPGESKTVELSEEEGYGPHLPGYNQHISLDELPDGLSVGDGLRAQADGRTIIFWVKEMDEKSAVLDINHPLAGKKLVFDIELVSLKTE